MTAQSALETLMRAGNHFYKVIDEHTIIVAQDTPQNRRIYEDLVIQTFFLSNSEVKDMMTILRSLVDAKKIATNEQLNAIILRDTADKVKVAERIIEANDKSKAEVVIDVELLQINSGRLRDLGVTLSSYSVGQRLDTGGGAAPPAGGATAPGGIRVSDLEFINQSNWFLTLPNFVYNFIKENTDAQLLAKPQLRITDGEKASLVIGDKVPIPLTTFNTSNTVGGNIVPITSFQYQDVGIRIDIEPRVHHNQEVTLKIKVAVDQINGYRGDQPIIGTRTIESVIRLQDGETNFLAGLIRSDESNSERGMPGLSEIPIIGRLFSNKRTDAQRTDVDPDAHAAHHPQRRDHRGGPAADLGRHRGRTSPSAAAARASSPRSMGRSRRRGTPEEIQDAIRRRLQRLPRGLRPEDGGTSEDVEVCEEARCPPSQQPPPGMTSRRPAPPSDIFRPPTPPPVARAGAAGGGGGAAGERRRRLVASGPSFRRAAARSARRRTERGMPREGQAGPRGPALAGSAAAVRSSPGERFVVKVQAEAGQPISHLPLSLSYDPAVLAVERSSAGASRPRRRSSPTPPVPARWCWARAAWARCRR